MFILNKRQNLKQSIFIGITAIVVISICSKSSPLYPLNDWLDANCFFTVGKSMLHGLVPYRDLFEQKGPLLYMLHAVAALVSETSFLGVYFLEIVACFAFLYFSFKIMKLYEPNISILTIPVLAASIYSARCFCHGDSAEELCLPLYAVAIYFIIKAIKNNCETSYVECFVVGITSSCVLWIKFTMLGFYIGWFFAVAYLLFRKKKLSKIFPMLAMIALGVLIPTIPILIYFGVNHALSDLWTVYFYDNLFYYTSTSDQSTLFSSAYNLIYGLGTALFYNFIVVFLICAVVFIFFKKKDKTEWISFVSMVFFTVLLLYVGAKARRYYSLILGAFAPIGIAVLYQMVKRYQLSFLKGFKHITRYATFIVCILCVCFSFVRSNNTYLLQYSKSDMPQYQFAEIINQTEDATLLNYGFLDGGFYTTTGIVPSCRYFCKLNIDISEMMEVQDDVIAKGEVDFVVTRDLELDSDLYECVATSTFYFEGSNREYRLYQLSSISSNE